MFGLGFTRSDLVRAVWSFIFGALAYVVLAQTSVIDGTVDWKALAIGAVVAGLSAAKNFLLADGSALKG